MKKAIRDNIEIILVEPAEPGNIGSTARAMNNMGFLNLGLVKPAPYRVPEAYKFAWNSHDILDNARVYPDIPEAVRDKGFVVAMSTRRGKERGHFELMNEFVNDIHQRASKARVAILFGCESWGLTNEDLVYANRVVRIYTAPRFSSLNLAQAVLITCYELLCSGGVPPDERPKPASGEELEKCFTHIESVLHLMGYGTRGTRLLPQNIIKLIRRAAGRAVLDAREVRMIRGLCSQVEKMKDGFKLRKKKPHEDLLD